MAFAIQFRWMLLAGLALVAGPSTAQACSFEERSRTQLFARASAVFVAHFLQTEEVKGTNSRGDPEVEATFRAMEIFKGQPPSDGKVRTFVFGPGNCSVPFLAGSDYLLFLYDNNFVSLPGGSEMFFNLEGTEPKKIFQELRELAKKGP